MNRKTFLKLLGIGAAAAPAVSESVVLDWNDSYPSDHEYLASDALDLGPKVGYEVWVRAQNYFTGKLNTGHRLAQKEPFDRRQIEYWIDHWVFPLDTPEVLLRDIHERGVSDWAPYHRRGK